MFQAFGYDVIRYLSPLESNLNINENLGYDMELEATECICLIKNNTMLSKRRLVTLYQQVAYCETANIEGCFVECGVWKGGAIGLMALANLRRGSTRRQLHLFDAFQEICEPDKTVDGERALREVRQFMRKNGHNQGKMQALRGIYDRFGGPGNLEDNRLLLEEIIGYPGNYIQYHVGWFQQTLPADNQGIDKIAILHLDSDWHASTKICLEYLYDKVVSGGIVIIDDYGTYDGCKVAVDNFIKLKQIQVYLASVDRDCRFFIKR